MPVVSMLFLNVGWGQDVSFEFDMTIKFLDSPV